MDYEEFYIKLCANVKLHGLKYFVIHHNGSSTVVEFVIIDGAATVMQFLITKGNPVGWETAWGGLSAGYDYTLNRVKENIVNHGIRRVRKENKSAL